LGLEVGTSSKIVKQLDPRSIAFDGSAWSWAGQQLSVRFTSEANMPPPGLVPGIHVFLLAASQDVDGRV
jgi:hypothetical protein